MERAWIEVEKSAFDKNIQSLKQFIPAHTQIMAVVQGDAYGHGSVETAKYLNFLGIRAFAAATLSEGITLRKHGIQGVILILGYTAPEDMSEVIRFDLCQTVVDFEHAKALESFGERIPVHIKLDVGMHRLGESPDNSAALRQIYGMPHLDIRGTYSHLSVSDGQDPASVRYTKRQICYFDRTITMIRSWGYDPGKIHLQGSYGVVNYPHLDYNYVRIGIMLYGVKENKTDVLKAPVHLYPALSLKARVSSVKTVAPGDYISYGLDCPVHTRKKIATVTIGYGDGIPRNAGFTGLQALIHGQYASVCGRICMDQLMVDVTGMENVRVGDEVVFIGQSQNREITAEEMAKRAGTITNELLSRLGGRLERKYI